MYLKIEGAFLVRSTVGEPAVRFDFITLLVAACRTTRTLSSVINKPVSLVVEQGEKQI